MVGVQKVKMKKKYLCFYFFLFAKFTSFDRGDNYNPKYRLSQLITIRCLATWLGQSRSLQYQADLANRHCVREGKWKWNFYFFPQIPNSLPFENSCTLVLFPKSKDVLILFKISKITFQNQMHFSELSFFFFRSKTVKKDVNAFWWKVWF